MVFRKSRRKIELKEDVIIDNVKIDFVTQTKFLGVILDQHLTFEPHVQYTKGKIARGIGILYKAKKYLKESSMKTLYYAFIYPYFTSGRLKIECAECAALKPKFRNFLKIA